MCRTCEGVSLLGSRKNTAVGERYLDRVVANYQEASFLNQKTTPAHEKKRVAAVAI
jgi:hypothetical protein